MEYIVKPGDFLFSIAETQLGDGQRYTEIYEMNKSTIGADPNLIQPGMRLKLPPASPSSGDIYVVKAGDFLYSIAETQLGDGQRYKEIYEMNKATIGADPNLIHPGMRLKLPKK